MKEAEAALNTANTDCTTTSADYESTVAARIQELKLISNAIGAVSLKGTTSGAASQTYSFLQTAASSQLKTRAIWPTLKSSLGLKAGA